jgi:hypothetical protein
MFHHIVEREVVSYLIIVVVKGEMTASSMAVKVGLNGLSSLMETLSSLLIAGTD